MAMREVVAPVAAIGPGFVFGWRIPALRRIEGGITVDDDK